MSRPYFVRAARDAVDVDDAPGHGWRTDMNEGARSPGAERALEARSPMTASLIHLQAGDPLAEVVAVRGGRSPASYEPKYSLGL